ncbi:YdcF family protein [Patescibacteria group bacterium]|nr:YdcF family protein [Patescibacteria group bacterium]
MKKIINRIVWGGAVLIALVFALPLFIGWYLSPQDSIRKADAIVTVSGGDNNARIKKTVELYKEGWAPYIIYSGAAAEGNVSNAAAMRNISVKSGIPSSRIFIEEESVNTEENAKFTAKIIKEKEYKSIILVTSPYHQRRTMNQFKSELGDDLEIINQSAIDEDWRKRGWWEDEQGRFLTIGELGKIFVDYIQSWRIN